MTPNPATTAKYFLGELRMLDLWKIIRENAKSAKITVEGLCPLGGPYTHSWTSRTVRVLTMDEAGKTDDNPKSPDPKMGRRKGIHLTPPEDMAWRRGRNGWVGSAFVQFKEKIKPTPGSRLTIATTPSDWWTITGTGNRETITITFLDDAGKPLPNPFHT